MQYNPPTGGAANDGYVGKNVAAGIQGSKVPPGAAEFPQRELVNIITDAGMAPTNADLAQASQAIRSGKLNFFPDQGTADALLIKPGRAYADVGAGTQFSIFKGNSANATTTPTLTVSGVTLTIVREDGSALAAGDLPANCLFTVRSDGTRLHVQGLRKGEVITNLQSTGAEARFKQQNLNADMVYDPNASTNYTNVFAGTDLGTFTVPVGYVGIELRAECYVPGGDTGVNMSIYLSIWSNANDGTGWLFQESQRNDKTGAAIMNIGRTCLLSLDPTKSYTFAARVIRDKSTTNATGPSGNLLGLAFKF